jgi:hypothetical protein
MRCGFQWQLTQPEARKITHGKKTWLHSREPRRSPLDATALAGFRFPLNTGEFVAYFTIVRHSSTCMRCFGLLKTEASTTRGWRNCNDAN